MPNRYDMLCQETRHIQIQAYITHNIRLLEAVIVHALLWNNTYRSLACIIDNGDHIGSHALDKGKTFADIGQFVLTVGKIWSDLKTLSKLHGQVWQNFDR